jgi:hypothetical protein
MSAAILDYCRLLRLTQDGDAETGRTVLDRIVAMLTAMSRKLDQSGADARAGAEQRKM